jgi:WhiB family transcriptional regulator, redox-sensing transcriptional regulator
MPKQAPHLRPGVGAPHLPRALCREVAEDWWHDPDDRSPATRQAVAICRACPERLDCGSWALDHDEDGVWGGMTRQERDLIRRQLGLTGRRRW